MSSRGIVAPQYQNEDAAREYLEKVRSPEAREHKPRELGKTNA